MTARLRGWLSGVAAAGLAVLACAIVTVTPPESAPKDAILVAGEAGHPVVGRNLSVTVLDVHRTDTIVLPDGDERDGSWIAVRVSAEATETEVDAGIGLAKLVIGDRTYTADRSVRDSMQGANVHLGSATAGWLVFDVATDATEDTARVQVTNAYATPSRDSLLDIAVEVPSMGDPVEITKPAPLDDAGDDEDGTP